jgi:ribosomal protein S18 acetylase RimI-like enzyme
MEFLLRVYGSTREEELAMVVDWTAEQKESFVRQQFGAQHAWYQEHYVGASFEVILVDGVPAGRLYVHRRPAEIRLVDIAFLPEFRGGGLGTSILRELLAEGEAAGKPVTIHVEIYNPAMRLYERLGFRPIEDRGPYRLLEWRPSAAGPRL